MDEVDTASWKSCEPGSKRPTRCSYTGNAFNEDSKDYFAFNKMDGHKVKN